MSLKYHDETVGGLSEVATVVEANNNKPVTSAAVKNAIDNPVAIKIEAASASESVATYNGRLDAVLATMKNNSCMLVEAYPPQIWAKGVCLCVLYKYNANTASLQTVSDTDAIHRCNFVIAKNGGTWGDIEYFATKSAFTNMGLIPGGLWNAQILAPKTGDTPDLNNITTTGFVAVGVGTLNAPSQSSGYYGICFTGVYLDSPLRAFQIVLYFDAGFGIHYRSTITGSSGWSSWKMCSTTT